MKTMVKPETQITPSSLTAMVKAVLPEVIEMRRHLHRHPELSGQEEQTARFVFEKCAQLGISIRTDIGGHGLLAQLKADHADEWVALRADMDALPIHDAKSCSYASQTDGISHACGHDAHTAMLLGAMMILKQLPQELPFHVACVFQPAEELTTGAAAMLADGLFSVIQPRRIHALHVYPYLPSGSIGMRAGPMCAAADMFEVEISGHGGHAARPHECTDVILVASHIIQALHHIVSRKVDPMDPAVLTVGHIEAGHAANVIPDCVRFSGTVRSLNPDTHEAMRKRMDRIIRQTAETWGAVAHFDMTSAAPVLYNDPAIVEKAEVWLRNYLPDTPLINIDEPSMGGEDFAEFLQLTPGCLLRLGTGNTPETRYPLHHPCFDIDEAAMAAGIGALVSLCLGNQ
ncbi:MAG: M20 family metallopeptidase [Mariprofundaceae bacterium]